MIGDNLVFLVGAGRSGTTLLYKILAAHQRVGYLSNYQNRYPTWTATSYLHRILNQFPAIKREAWFQKGGGAYFNERRTWLKSLVPTPSEAEPVYDHCGLPLSPQADYLPNESISACLRNSFEKIRRRSGASVLLSKRTANNRRIPQLVRIFPNARYIHLVRDGRAVAYSLLRVAWWGDHCLYWAENKTPSKLVQEGANPLELASQNWVEEMKSLEQGLSELQNTMLLQVGYESLLERPFDELRRIFAFMGIAINDDPDYLTTINTLGLSPKEESWQAKWGLNERVLVDAIQRTSLDRWGYK